MTRPAGCPDRATLAQLRRVVETELATMDVAISMAQDAVFSLTAARRRLAQDMRGLPDMRDVEGEELEPENLEPEPAPACAAPASDSR